MIKTKQPTIEVIETPDKGWFWRLDIDRDDGWIGPFETEREAAEDASETFGSVIEKTRRGKAFAKYRP